MIGTRPFGYDRQPVPEIGMGCYRITTDMGVDRPTALATLQRAYELGVRFFDTAPLYGAGEADALLGEAFAHVPDDEIIIGAKLSGPTDNLRDYSYDNCMRGFDQTLQHLKRDSVHVLQIHGIPGWRDLAADRRREWNDVFGKGMAYEALLRHPRTGRVQVHWRDEPLVATPPALSGARGVRQRGDRQPLQPADECSPADGDVGGRADQHRGGRGHALVRRSPGFVGGPGLPRACAVAATPRRQRPSCGR